MKIDIIIPTYKPDEKFEKLIMMIKKQTLKPNNVIVVNTEESLFSSDEFRTLSMGRIIHIKKEEFDHGGTRNLAASISDADIIVFFTQDAVPANEYVIERLVKPFEDADVAATYGRQLADHRKDPLEAYTRVFNYPKESRVKSIEDLEELGIKTFFLSNVCSAYRKAFFDSVGGFPRHTIFGEDTIFASKVIYSCNKIAYVADAKVWHWHSYSAKDQFKRNFDVGVGQIDAGGAFVSIKSESEGIKLVKSTLLHFLKRGKILLIPHIIVQNGAKFIGYKLGRAYKKLPLKIVKKLSFNPAYWE